MVRDPCSPEEWQNTADAAVFCLALHSAELYDLVEGPDVDVDRAFWILDQAAGIPGVVIKTLQEVLSAV